MDHLDKKYKMTSSEKFDEFMKAIGEFSQYYLVLKAWWLNRCGLPAGFCGQACKAFFPAGY